MRASIAGPARVAFDRIGVSAIQSCSSGPYRHLFPVREPSSSMTMHQVGTDQYDRQRPVDAKSAVVKHSLRVQRQNASKVTSAEIMPAKTIHGRKGDAHE